MSTAPEPFSVLLSFWYYRSDNAMDAITGALRQARDEGRPIRLLLDSGAFSALTQGHSITAEDYAAWLDLVMPLWGEWVVGAINLDVIGEAGPSWANWTALRDRGHDTMPVTHLGDTFDVADRYVDAGADYLATGNLVGSGADRMLRWCAHLHRHLRDHHPDVRLHALGATGRRIVERLPWWSIDASSFGAAYRYGRLVLFDPRTRGIHYVKLPGHRNLAAKRTTDLYRHGALLRDLYGVDPAAIHEATPENRHLLVRIATLATLFWQADLRSRRQVPPPPSRKDRQLTGTHVHAVDGYTPHMVQAIGTHVGTHVHYAEGSSGITAEVMGAAAADGHRADPKEA